MSSSRARNFRRRPDDDEDDDANQNGPSSTTTSKPLSKPSTTSSKPKKPQQQKQAHKPKLLSFADDDDAASSDHPHARPPRSKSSSSSSRPTTKPLSTSSSSHKLTSSKDRNTTPSPSLPSNVLPQAGTYTKEALLELQKNTRTLVRPSAAPDPKPDPKPEPVIVLRGLLKPETGVPVKAEELGNGRENEEDEEEVEDEGPDQAMIDAIRAKRERMRQSHAAAPDYISLDAGSVLGSGTAEGISDEEPEFRERIAMFGDRKKKGVFESFEEKVVIGKKGKGRAEYEYELREEEDEDEEEKIWEEEQFRKGLGKRVDDGIGRGIVNGSMSVQQRQQNFMYAGAVGGGVYGGMQSLSVVAPPPPLPSATLPPPSIGGAVAGVPDLDGMTIKQQAEVARKALKENSMRLKVEPSLFLS